MLRDRHSLSPMLRGYSQDTLRPTGQSCPLLVVPLFAAFRGSQTPLPALCYLRRHCGERGACRGPRGPSHEDMCACGCMTQMQLGNS